MNSSKFKQSKPGLSRGHGSGDRKELVVLTEVFPEWNQDDLAAVLAELDGDVELAINRISEGHAIQWSKVGERKTQKKPLYHYKQQPVYKSRNVSSKAPVPKSLSSHTTCPQASAPPTSPTPVPPVSLAPAAAADPIAAVATASADSCLVVQTNSVISSQSAQVEEIILATAEQFAATSLVPTQNDPSPKHKDVSGHVDKAIENSASACVVTNLPVEVVKLPETCTVNKAKVPIAVEPTAVLFPIQVSVRPGLDVSFGTTKGIFENKSRMSNFSGSKYVNASIEASNGQENAIVAGSSQLSSLTTNHTRSYEQEIFGPHPLYNSFSYPSPREMNSGYVAPPPGLSTQSSKFSITPGQTSRPYVNPHRIPPFHHDNLDHFRSDNFRHHDSTRAQMRPDSFSRQSNASHGSANAYSHEYAGGMDPQGLYMNRQEPPFYGQPNNYSHMMYGGGSPYDQHGMNQAYGNNRYLSPPQYNPQQFHQTGIISNTNTSASSRSSNPNQSFPMLKEEQMSSRIPF